MYTPWGYSQGSKPIAPGITEYHTPGQGGIRLTPRRQAHMPDYLRLGDADKVGWYGGIMNGPLWSAPSRSFMMPRPKSTPYRPSRIRFLISMSATLGGPWRAGNPAPVTLPFSLTNTAMIFW